MPDFLVARIIAAPSGRIFAKYGMGGGLLWKFVKEIRIWFISNKNIDHCAWHLGAFVLLTAVRNILNPENSAKGTQRCFSIATIEDLYIVGSCV